ncbi:protein O-mannosyl-transferase TMTC3 [Dermatophagoides farinae]|uniref:protein O-mannosyl-transferase TMTC3 n=1 Tax=Dermatophagoides farinae TaxID=6954 RepID=UPI003F62DB06
MTRMKSSSSLFGHIYPYIVITVTITIVFHNSLDCDFTFDDTSAIVQNRHVHTNETDWFRIFDVDYWGTPIRSEHSHKSYRPFTSLTFRWNHLWSPALNPYEFHLTNVLLHIIVSFICFEFLRIMLGPQNRWPACLFTLYFAIHPIKSEAVTSIVGRAELLSTLFILISLFCYFKNAYINFAITVLLASYSKEQGMTTPAICIAIECLKLMIQFKSLNYLPFWSRLWHSLLNLTMAKIIALIAYTAILIGTRIYLAGSSLPIFTKFDNPASFEETPSRQLTYNYLLPLNVRLMLWPRWLCADWTMNSIPLVKTFDDSRNAWTAIFYLVFIILSSRAFYLATSKQSKRLFNIEIDIERSNLLISLILIVIPFIPASNLLFPVGFVLAERILYTPSIGFTTLLAIGWLRIQNYFQRSRFIQFLLNFSTILMLVTFTFRTYERNFDWHNDLTLFKSGLMVNPNNAKLYNNIGHYYERRGEWSEAIKYFRLAADKDHEDIGAELNVARSLIRLNRLKDAEDLLWAIKPRVRTSILKNRMVPQYLNIWINLAHVISMNQTRLHEAENLYQEVLTIRSDFVDAYINLGELYIRKQLFDQAQETYEKALQRARHIDDGKRADIHYNLAIAKSLKLDHQQQKPSGSKLGSLLNEIAQDLMIAIDINREHREAIINLAILLQRPQFPSNNQNEYRTFAINALRSYSRSNELESFQFNIAITLLDIGGPTNRMDAIHHFKRAAELKPDFRSALYNLALLYYDFKDYEQSLFYLNRTLEHYSNYTKALLLTADIYSRMERLDDTEKTYTKVLEMDHNNYEAIHNLCMIYKQTQRKKEQEKCLLMLNDFKLKSML